MTSETWSVIFAGGTFVVIAATAVAALIQLRHLRAGNQLTTLLTIMRMWNQPDMQEHIRYLRGALQDKLKDPAFMQQFATGPLTRSDHPELLVADFWEQIGAFVKYDLLDERPVLDIAGGQALLAWNAVEPAVMAMRTRSGNAVFENFEYIAVRAQLWKKAHPDGAYPTKTPRMAQLEAQLRST